MNPVAQASLSSPLIPPCGWQVRCYIADSAPSPSLTESVRKTMRIDPREIALCLQHLRLCRMLGGARGAYAEVNFLVARLAQVFDRRVSQEAYWAAAERENLTWAAPDGTPWVSVDPVSAWALVAARNERLGRATFHGFHPIPVSERTRVWALRPRALRALRGERGPRCPPIR